MSDSDDKYIEELYKTLSYSNEQFDKHVLFIASGAFGVSFAFIENIIPNLNEATHTDYLIGAWYVYALVIFISLVSHFLSSQSISWSIRNYGAKKWEKGFKRWNWLTRSLNILMISGLFYGTILLINFINKNI